MNSFSLGISSVVVFVLSLVSVLMVLAFYKHMMISGWILYLLDVLNVVSVCAAYLKGLRVEWEGTSCKVEKPMSWYSGHLGSQSLLDVASHLEHCPASKLFVPAALTQPNVEGGRGEWEIMRVIPLGYCCSRTPTNYPISILRLTTPPETYHLHMWNSFAIAPSRSCHFPAVLNWGSHLQSYTVFILSEIPHTFWSINCNFSKPGYNFFFFSFLICCLKSFLSFLGMKAAIGSWWVCSVCLLKLETTLFFVNFQFQTHTHLHKLPLTLPAFSF